MGIVSKPRATQQVKEDWEPVDNELVLNRGEPLLHWNAYWKCNGYTLVSSDCLTINGTKYHQMIIGRAET